MPRKPAHPLPDDRARRRNIKYLGTYVVWWDDGNWEWLKCVICGAELTTPKSRESGCGPTCEAVTTAAAKEAILEQERTNAYAYLEEKARPRRPTRRPAKRATVDTSGFKTTKLPPASKSVSHPPPTKPRGITNDQAKELARLQRAAGETYSGNAMTQRQAALEIRRLKQ